VKRGAGHPIAIKVKLTQSLYEYFFILVTENEKYRILDCFVLFSRARNFKSDKNNLFFLSYITTHFAMGQKSRVMTPFAWNDLYYTPMFCFTP
jgi:hypothetical protein